MESMRAACRAAGGRTSGSLPEPAPVTCGSADQCRRLGSRQLVGRVDLDAGWRCDMSGQERVVGVAHPGLQAAAEVVERRSVGGIADEVVGLLRVEDQVEEL